MITTNRQKAPWNYAYHIRLARQSLATSTRFDASKSLSATSNAFPSLQPGRVHTNLAESYFSRLRRMIGGQHLRVEGRYLDAYATMPPGSRITVTKAMDALPIG